MYLVQIDHTPGDIILADDLHRRAVGRLWITVAIDVFTAPLSPKRKLKFMFRSDPRDISLLWFYDPELALYYPIPYRDTSHPPISLWELREARQYCKADGRRHIDERTIFEAYDEMQAIVEQAQAKTAMARRATQRHKMGLAAPKPATPERSPETAQPTILPFDDRHESNARTLPPERSHRQAAGTGRRDSHHADSPAVLDRPPVSVCLALI